MGFWSSYRASLKPLEVEEPIDVFVHRPLAFLLAKACFRLPVSPDFITLMSIVAGVGSALTLVASFPHHLVVGGLLLFGSAVLDCADGQLARMRGTSSAFGRMLDGVADLITIGAVAPATLWVMCRDHLEPRWLLATLVVLGCSTMVTTSFHTTMYDHYKNVFLRFTGPYQEAEDYESARRRAEQSERRGRSAFEAIAYTIYLFYLKSQRDYVARYDPYTTAALSQLPPFNPERAAVYRRCAGSAMRMWRWLFGFGSLVFGLALFNALGHPEYFMVYRLVVLNGIFYLYLRPVQRRASREAFRAMQIASPEQTLGTSFAAS